MAFTKIAPEDFKEAVARGMSGSIPRPLELKIVCALFLVYTVLSIAFAVLTKTEVAGISTTYLYSVGAGVLGFIAAIGLWRYSFPARVLALIITWIQ